MSWKEILKSNLEPPPRYIEKNNQLYQIRSWSTEWLRGEKRMPAEITYAKVDKNKPTAIGFGPTEYTGNKEGIERFTEQLDEEIIISLEEAVRLDVSDKYPEAMKRYEDYEIDDEEP